MSKVAAILNKEFRSYWYSPIAYIVITVFIVLVSFFFFRGFYIIGDASLRGFFGLLPWLFLFVVPALTMRQWAEELHSGTIETLMTKPVMDWQIVIGKYLSAVLFLVIMLVLTLPLPLTVAGISQSGIDWGVLLANYIGALLLGAAYLAIGGWAGSFTSNQIVAFILGIVLIFVGIMIGEGIITMFAPGFLATPLQYLGLNQHFTSIARGVIDTRDIIFYLSVMFLFLYLTVRAVESRKWS